MKTNQFIVSDGTISQAAFIEARELSIIDDVFIPQFKLEIKG